MSHLPDADLEVRKHLWRGLERMQPAQRVGFLKRLCRKATLPVAHVEPRVTSHTGTVHEAFHDICMLSFQHQLPLATSATELERVLRGL